MRRLGRLMIKERTVISVVLLDALALTAMSFTDAEHVGLHHLAEPVEALVYRVASLVDLLCVIYFVVETSLKIGTYGWRRYWARGWNRFDFCVVMASIPVIVAPLLNIEELGVLMALRLGRLFRLFRLMHFIPNRAHLWTGVKRALKASVGIFLALLIINLVFSLGATQLFGRIVPEHFGNPALSTYSLFRVFTIEGWYEIPDAIAARAPHAVVGVLARLYFMGAVLIGGIFGVALANAVFVDEMTIDNNDDLERKIDALVDEVRSLRTELGARGERSEET
jgi:voltage-gated sodium channel